LQDRRIFARLRKLKQKEGLHVTCDS
jgi:hypothetical protein